MNIKIKRLNSGAKIPVKAHTTDAGFDLYATDVLIDDDGNFVYKTGIAIELPKGYVGLIFPRSSICKTDLSLSNAVGVIDSGYRGEITAKFKVANKVANVYGVVHPTTPKAYHIEDRIVQLIILPYPEIEFEEVEELSDSDRGKNGYGSTGR